MDVEGLKQRMVARVDELADVLVETSRAIHARPEVGYEERFAADLLASVLEREGLDVVRGAYEIETAFAARAGDAGPLVAVCLEYDALPGLGHAGGHNVIAAAGLGAGLAAAAAAGEAGGRVVVLGTPAEEGGGGKVLMAQRGAFDGVDVAMMVHPSGADLTLMSTVAITTLDVEWSGASAHAAAAPWKGRNALDAAVLGYVGVAALRQHIQPTDRVHGVFTAGGDKANIVPEHAAMQWMVRSATVAGLAPLRDRVVAALEAGAAATGCTMTWRAVGCDYAEMRDNDAVIDLYRANMAALGRVVEDPRHGGTQVLGSTDMGNVSHLVPSIHPMVRVSPVDVPIHSREFERWAGGEEGDAAVLDGAKAMAMTIADLWTSPDDLAAARAEFEAAAGA
jgi:amidohydrolase